MTPDESSRPERRVLPDRRRPGQAMVPYVYPDDEVNLVEVGASLWRRWKLMLAVFLACVGIGLALAFVVPRSYSYTAVVRLGSYTKVDGTNVPVVTPDSAVAALNGGFIDTAIHQVAASDPVDPRKITITASASAGPGGGQGDTVMLSGKAPQSLGDAYRAVEQAASAMLAKSTAARINVIRANIQQELSQARIKLARIQDPQRVKAAKSALQQDLASKKANLANLKQQLAVLQDKRARLQDAEKLYARQEKELNAYISKARKASIAASDAGTPTQAMAVLLLNNQIQQNLQQLNNIEEKLTVSLPQQIAAADADIADNQQKQLVQQNAIDQAEARLANFDAEHQRDVESQQAEIAAVKTRLDNVQATQLVVGPSRSIEPVGLGRAAIAVLGAVAGVILALLAAGAANYLHAVRRRLRPADRTG